MQHEISIIYEDDYMVIVNKPAKIASVPSEGISEIRTVLGIFVRQCVAQGRDFTPYLLHRLDMQTSGVLMFGKHERDREKLEGILKEKTSHKKYTTLVKGLPRGHIITAKLKARNSDVRIFAQTAYKVLKVYKILGTVVSLVEAEIKTGRKHQIRQHFASIKCPVVLDPEYGDFAFNRKFRVLFRLGRMFLHSSSIEFTHPILGTKVKVEAPLPLDLKHALERVANPKQLDEVAIGSRGGPQKGFGQRNARSKKFEAKRANFKKLRKAG